MITTTTNTKQPKLIQTEIVASFSGTIESGRYSNEKPLFSFKETYADASESFILQRQKFLADLCYDRFMEVEQRSKIEKLKEAYKNLRFYEIGGAQYPSVTSILNWDTEFSVTETQLAQYAARGTILHKQVEVFLESGEWKEPKDLPEIYKEWLIVEKGDLKLSLDNTDFPSYFKKYPFEVISLEKEVCNHHNRYAGRCDIKGVMDGKVTLFDVKTSTAIDRDRKLKFLKQLTAYAHAEGNQDVEQLCIIHLNGSTKQGFSQPIIEEDVNKYWAFFLKDREEFKKTFGV